MSTTSSPPLRRSSRTTLSSCNHLHYDLKYHPVDDIIRPSQATKRKAAHNIEQDEHRTDDDDDDDDEEEGGEDGDTQESEEDDHAHYEGSDEEEDKTVKPTVEDIASSTHRHPAPRSKIRTTRARLRRSKRRLSTTPVYSQKVHPQDDQIDELSDEQAESLTDTRKHGKAAKFERLVADYEAHWLSLTPPATTTTTMNTSGESQAQGELESEEGSITDVQHSATLECADSEDDQHSRRSVELFDNIVGLTCCGSVVAENEAGHVLLAEHAARTQNTIAVNTDANAEEEADEDNDDGAEPPDPTQDSGFPLSLQHDVCGDTDLSELSSAIWVGRESPGSKMLRSK